jgi:LuxR family quorum sensing-dependent transcriptional regulator
VLTARQLQVVLLAHDGLRQAEIAACLGISARQVERHLEQARKRAKAATTAQLVAMLVGGRLAPASQAPGSDSGV